MVEVSTNRLDIINGTITDDTKVQMYTCEILPLLTPGINGNQVWDTGYMYVLLSLLLNRLTLWLGATNSPTHPSPTNPEQTPAAPLPPNPLSAKQ